MTGLGMHMFGIYCAAEGNAHASWSWFITGTVLWIGTVTVIGIFYRSPVTAGSHAR